MPSSLRPESPINRVPPEILLEIFEWILLSETTSFNLVDLLECSLVCKSWNGPVRAVFFRHVVLETGDNEVPDERLSRFRRTVDTKGVSSWGLEWLVLHLDLTVTDARVGDRLKLTSLKPGADVRAINCWERAISFLPNLRELSFRAEYSTARLIPYLKSVDASPSAQSGKIRRLRLYSLQEARIHGCFSSDIAFLCTLKELAIDSFIGSIGQLILKNGDADTQNDPPLFRELVKLDLEGVGVEDDTFRDLMGSVSDELQELSVSNTLVGAGCFLEVLKDRKIRTLTIWQNEDAVPTLLEAEAMELVPSGADPKLLDLVTLFPFDLIISRLRSLIYLSLNGPGFSGNILRALPPTIVCLYLTDCSDVTRDDVFDFLAYGGECADGAYYGVAAGKFFSEKLTELKVLMIDIGGNHQHYSWRDAAWIKHLEEKEGQESNHSHKEDEEDSEMESLDHSVGSKDDASGNSVTQDVREIALERAARAGPLGLQLRDVVFTIAKQGELMDLDDDIDMSP